jgi:hypothetical protein
LENPEIKSRIWIGFQGLLEFLNNRHDTISDQKNKFGTVRAKLLQAISSYDDLFKALTSDMAKLKLRQKHSLIDPDKFLTPKNINSGINFVHEFLADLNELEEKQSDVQDKDDTKKHVIELFAGKIGYGFTTEELNKIYSEGEERYKHDVPPGYKDKSKAHFYTVLGIEYKCKFGDLLLWHEIIRKAQTDHLEYVILVTGDLKEDWWLEKRGKKLGPRKELLNEIYTKAPDLKAFHMYDTSNFLRRVSEKLTVSVSESTISETENLLAADRDEADLVVRAHIPNILDIVTSNLDGFVINKSVSFMSLPPVKISISTLYDAFFEIVYNVKNHASSKSLIVDSRMDKNFRTIRFSNACSEIKSPSMGSFDNDMGSAFYARGAGLKMIDKLFAREGVDVHRSHDGAIFMLEVFIPLSKFQ